MDQKGRKERKLFDILKEKKYLRYLTYAKLTNQTGSALYNLALLMLASKQTYSTLAISLVKLFGDIPSLIDPFLAYLTDHETKRLKSIPVKQSSSLDLFFNGISYVRLSSTVKFFLLVVLGNIISDTFDGYISNLFAPFSKTWVASNVSSFSIIMLSLSIVIGQFLGAG